MKKTLYLSFWNLSLENFPEGGFTMRAITAEEAKGLIDTAQDDKTLRCVTDDDILVPYKKRELKNHHELVVALKEVGIILSLDGFTMEPDPESGMTTINPLQFASISEQADLIVVNCHYTMGKVNHDAKDVDEMLNSSVAEGSITFHLFEAVSSTHSNIDDRIWNEEIAAIIDEVQSEKDDGTLPSADVIRANFDELSGILKKSIDRQGYSKEQLKSMGM